MRRAVARSIIALAMLSLVSCTYSVKEMGNGHGGTPISDDQKRVFTLLDRFDPLDTSELPFVKVRTNDQSNESGYRYGFLVESTGKHFEIRYLDLGKARLEASPPGTPEHERIGFETVSLRAFAQKTAREQAIKNQNVVKKTEQIHDAFRFYLSQDTPTHPRPLMMLLARACARRKMNIEMLALWEVLPDEDRHRWRTRKKRNTALVAEFELPLCLLHRLSLDFLETAYSWQDLLVRHELWLDVFKSHDYARMVDAVKWHRDGILKVLDVERKLTRQAKGKIIDNSVSMKALVLDLRNERYPLRRKVYDGFELSPLEPMPENGSPIVGRLLRAGLKAAPALIESLDDRTLTRSVRYNSRHGGAFAIHCLGDLARETLIKIAGGCVAVNSGQDEKNVWLKWYEIAKTHGWRKAHTEMIRSRD